MKRAPLVLHTGALVAERNGQMEELVLPPAPQRLRAAADAVHALQQLLAAQRTHLHAPDKCQLSVRHESDMCQNAAQSRRSAVDMI